MKLSLCINATDESEDCDSTNSDYPYINKFAGVLEEELMKIYPASKKYELAEI